MLNILYIIPGLGENCNLVRYKKLKKACEAKGYKVNCINPDWHQPVSKLIFKVEKGAVVLGFSMGAILAYLIAKKSPYKKAIFASISPIETFSFESYRDNLLPHMSKDNASLLAKDVKGIKISLESLKIKYVTLAGQRENMPADIIVPRTGHNMTDSYIKCIIPLLP